jgi:hypothetical protein
MLIPLSQGARQRKRSRWSLERLHRERSIALGLAIDPRSNLAYTSALNSYITFCNLHEFPIDPTEDTLSFFTVYMSHHIRPDSVDSYLSGICNQLEQYFPEVRQVRKSTLVSRTLKGCKCWKGRPIERKLPLLRDHLKAAFTQFSRSVNYEDILWLCLLHVGFDALLRVAEFTIPDNAKIRDWRKLT